MPTATLATQVTKKGLHDGMVVTNQSNLSNEYIMWEAIMANYNRCALEGNGCQDYEMLLTELCSASLKGSCYRCFRRSKTVAIMNSGHSRYS